MHRTCTLRDEQYEYIQPAQQVYCGAVHLHCVGSKAHRLVSANADTLKTQSNMPFTSSVPSNATVTTPAQRSGHHFLQSRRPALTREAPSRGSLLYTQALQLARLQDQEEAARTAFEECCRADPDNTKVGVHHWSHCHCCG